MNSVRIRQRFTDINTPANFAGVCTEYVERSLEYAGVFQQTTVSANDSAANEGRLSGFFIFKKHSVDKVRQNFRSRRTSFVADSFAGNSC